MRVGNGNNGAHVCECTQFSADQAIDVMSNAKRLMPKLKKEKLNEKEREQEKDLPQVRR
jgi:hypothetical protein